MDTHRNSKADGHRKPNAHGLADDGLRSAFSPAQPLVGPSVLRLPKALVDAIRRDLRRPHPLAAERVGFIAATTAAVEAGEHLVIALDYRSIPDEHYVDGGGAGARIGIAAIRAAVAETLTSGRGTFHVHLHEHAGIPDFSATDQREQPRLVDSFRVVSPRETHGMIVLSDDAANAWVWTPGSDSPSVPSRLSIVGDPLVLLTGDMLVRDSLRNDDDLRDEHHDGEDSTSPSPIDAVRTTESVPASAPTTVRYAPVSRDASTDRYARQSFLGPDSQRRLGTARVAVFGYGGGGSHVGLQLAHLGVLHIDVADGDRIDETNLNRLVGGTADDVEKQRLKVDIAKRVITSVLPSASIQTHAGRWQERPVLFRSADVIVGCVDSFAERRELEILARRFEMVYVDIGMDVHDVPGEPKRMVGQVILSMPGGPCMTCLGFLTPERLAAEAAQYGAAGGRPQVVWPNGILASSAVGVVVSLLTGWTGEEDRVIYLSYDGNRGTLVPHARLQFLGRTPCPHFPLAAAGEPHFRPARAAREHDVG